MHFIPAGAYDKIVACAEEIGGIGSDRLYIRTEKGDVIPCCLYGVAIDVGLYGPQVREQVRSSYPFLDLRDAYNQFRKNPLVPCHEKHRSVDHCVTTGNLFPS